MAVQRASKKRRGRKNGLNPPGTAKKDMGRSGGGEARGTAYPSMKKRNVSRGQRGLAGSADVVNPEGS